ncbi:MAG: hypothetical protein U1F50_06805 [Rubrivivax sp.]
MDSILDLQIRLAFGCAAILGAIGVAAMLLFANLASDLHWSALMALVAATSVGALEASGVARVSRFTPLRATVAVLIGTATLLLLPF